MDEISLYFVLPIQTTLAAVRGELESKRNEVVELNRQLEERSADLSRARIGFEETKKTCQVAFMFHVTNQESYEVFYSPVFAGNFPVFTSDVSSASRGGFKAESLLGHITRKASSPPFPSPLLPPLPSPPSPPLSFPPFSLPSLRSRPLKSS